VSGTACLGQVSVGMKAWQRVLQGNQGFIEGGLDKQPSQSEQNTSPQEGTHTPRTKQSISQGSFMSMCFDTILCLICYSQLVPGQSKLSIALHMLCGVSGPNPQGALSSPHCWQPCKLFMYGITIPIAVHIALQASQNWPTQGVTSNCACNGPLT